ncbi:MAG TPA: TonB-dependent receptor [Gammaproteobacteria bacterium]
MRLSSTRPFLPATLISSIAACFAGPDAVVAQQPESSSAIETIDVVGTTPLGANRNLDQIAANVQTATADDLREQAALDVADFMKRSMGSVFVNDAQNNPLQPDVQYRGFVASPLLGLPQGLAIYQDGVRVNEPFGDTVNWALIPESAISELYLVPGSSPLFGLNSLGGAVALHTKDGLTHAGTSAELVMGSFERLTVQAETGGSIDDDFGYFVTVSHFEEEGWRDYSPSEAEQLFAKLSARGQGSRLDVSLTYVDTDLIGNGAAPVDLLELDRAAIFTRPDQSKNELLMLNVGGEQSVSATIALRGNLYVRSSDVSTLNGDDSDFAECAGAPGFICEEEDGAEEIVLDENDDPIPFDDELEGATINRTSTEQDGFGFGFQTDFTDDLGGRDNLFTVGIAHDTANVDFGASTELGALDDTRLAVPGGAFVGEAFTGLKSVTDNTGIYLSETVTLGATALTLSGRYNRANVELTDQLDDDLDGDHTFQRFNPAVGVTVGADSLTFYAGYSEANRAPSPVELTCADEDDPCRLPNAFVADPPLEQVVAKTFELGARGPLGNGRWHAGAFSTTNEDDIIFISAGALTNQGFFDNVGETRRKGFEVNLAGGSDRISWSVDFTQLDATFGESFVVASPNNPAAVDGEIEVEAGDRLPLIPERLFKAGLRFAATESLSFGADLLAASEIYHRGDEGNLVATIDGYTVINLRGEYRFGARASALVSVDNVLDEEYATFGVLGEPDEVLGDDFEDPSFLGPGAPRAVWAGVRFSF